MDVYGYPKPMARMLFGAKPLHITQQLPGPTTRKQHEQWSPCTATYICELRALEMIEAGRYIYTRVQRMLFVLFWLARCCESGRNRQAVYMLLVRQNTL